ncbi:hypothetical protein GH714_037758 [Hevea brasiliensis]|uniref:CCHC-type domain-containing protein n=1 Tax=Hevea brasiliensis TaxID=3981 RepID=A0A6A6K9K3_HEVBR|nr:hypothetical protein GH714_037758 [Hevea brasiliensis]
MDDSAAEEVKKSREMFADSTMECLDNLNYDSWVSWKINIQLILNLHDLDLALREDKPTEPMDTSSAEEKAKYAKWVRSNYLSLLLMKLNMADHIYSFLSYTTKSDNAKQIFAALKDMIMNDERIRAPSMLKELVTMKYDGQGDVCQHLNKMAGLASRLRDVDVVLPEFLINQLALDSLPSQFGPVRMAYIMPTEKWGLNELIRRCRDHEKLISVPGKRVRTEENGNGSGNGKDSNYQQGNGAKKRRNVKCFSCGKKGHLAKNCRQASN